MSPAIVLFQYDLRLTDNPALTAAAVSKRPLILLYVYDPKEPWSMGMAQRWWLHESLLTMPSSLILRRGPLVSTILRVAKETGAEAIYWNRCYHLSRIQALRELENSLETFSFNGSLLVEPWEIASKQGTPFKVFTPFWKQCLSQLDPSPCLPKPRWKEGPLIRSDKLSSWKLKSAVNQTRGFSLLWTPGEIGARKKLHHFLKHHLADYATQRDRPDLEATSYLSAHLHMGEISPRQIWHALTSHTTSRGAIVFLSELGWREFSYHLLYRYPSLPEENFQKKFNRLKWVDNPQDLTAWQQGKTGYPIVDAGMRQLWHQGWMHNRVRMIVASFLTKDLFIDWRKGAEWFWDTLVDADLANNAASWQWVAGSGADAAPYFRIFNPLLQGEKFDPQGVYIKKWVPELRKVPTHAIHYPWEEAPDYPKPIVDHQQARDKALGQYKRL